MAGGKGRTKDWAWKAPAWQSAPSAVTVCDPVAPYPAITGKKSPPNTINTSL